MVRGGSLVDVEVGSPLRVTRQNTHCVKLPRLARYNQVLRLKSMDSIDTFDSGPPMQSFTFVRTTVGLVRLH